MVFTLKRSFRYTCLLTLALTHALWAGCQDSATKITSSQSQQQAEGSPVIIDKLAALLDMGSLALFFEDYVRDAMTGPIDKVAWHRFVTLLHEAAEPLESNALRLAGKRIEEIAELVFAAATAAGPLDHSSLENALVAYLSPQSVNACRFFLERRNRQEREGYPVLSGPSLRKLVRESRFPSVEHLMQTLQRGYLSRYTAYSSIADPMTSRFALVHSSDSSQTNSWRILWFSSLTEVALGIVGNPAQAIHRDDVEIIYTDCLAGRERFALARMDDNGLRMHYADESLIFPRVENHKVQQGTREVPMQRFCGGCHGGISNPADAHKNWYDYDSWLGLAGGESSPNQRFRQDLGSHSPADLSIYQYPNAQEAAGINDFIRSIDFRQYEDPRQMSRYALIGGISQLQAMAQTGFEDATKELSYPTAAYDYLAKFQNTALDLDIHNTNTVRLAQQVIAAIRHRPDREGVLEVIRKALRIYSHPANSHPADLALDPSVVRIFAQALCKNMPEHFGSRCDNGNMFEEVLDFDRKTVNAILERTGTIRQEFYQRATDNFGHYEVDDGAPTIEQVQQLDTIEHHGLTAYDYQMRFPLCHLMFVMKELGISTRHWSTTPARFGESYQFITVEGFRHFDLFLWLFGLPGA